MWVPLNVSLTAPLAPAVTQLHLLATLLTAVDPCFMNGMEYEQDGNQFEKIHFLSLFQFSGGVSYTVWYTDPLFFSLHSMLWVRITLWRCSDSYNDFNTVKPNTLCLISDMVKLPCCVAVWSAQRYRQRPTLCQRKLPGRWQCAASWEKSNHGVCWAQLQPSDCPESPGCQQ